MTDIYIAYAREDRERVRPLAESLQFEGWDVWWDPSDPSIDGSAALDQKLSTAGAILVIWSAYARGSEYVRSEAATGLYKNKLIQARIDSAAPPRPFDQVEVVDLHAWSGEREDPNWRRITQTLRVYAGAPGASRGQQSRKPIVSLAPKPASRPSKRSYLESERSIAWGPIAAVALLMVAGAGVWFLDPFSWRGPSDVVATSSPDEAGETELAAGSREAFVETPESVDAWRNIDRGDSIGLRTYVSTYPRSSNSETAQSLLRVLDAQAWVDAVTSDNEAGYSAYLKSFPVDGDIPGAMAGDARDRLVQLTVERTQAIEEIQRGLAALELYKGKVDGKGGGGTTKAVRAFASANKKGYPALDTAAPRDLRAFADLIEKAASDAGVDLPDVEPAPIIAAAATTTAAKPAVQPPKQTTASAAQADRQRIAEAKAAAKQAEDEAAATKKEDKDAAEKLAAQTLAISKADATAWGDAERTGTQASYQSYLAAYPAGQQAAAARGALSRLSRPAGFSLDQVSPAIRTAADAARRAQANANGRATAARTAAENALTAPGLRAIVAADGDRYETQISGGAPNGLGTRINGSANDAGDRYRGEIRAGETAGVGVYEFGSNPNNEKANALRYEGEHAGDGPTGYGVTYWKNGDVFAGQETGAPGAARGVLTFANGQRYEGELRNGQRTGLGVIWSADGQVLMAGRWENGQLVEPMTASPGAIQLAPNP
ncbi:MAG: TIR domain-containing protein [Hyphomonadaceae bacterium]|nr:TIR domain-containing protein [Hyphomonadaceae bacterium]